MRPISLHVLRPEIDYGWEAVRQIRNECAEFMTGYTGLLTQEMQNGFRERFTPEEEELYLIANGEPAGYLYLVRKQGYWWPTYAVTEDQRGKGYGKFLVSFSQTLRPELKLEVRASNRRAVNLYISQGFMTESAEKGVITMHWKRQEKENV